VPLKLLKPFIPLIPLPSTPLTPLMLLILLIPSKPRLIMTASEGEPGRSEDMAMAGWLEVVEGLKSSRDWPTMGVEPKEGDEMEGEGGRLSSPRSAVPSPILLLGIILPSREMSVMRVVRGWNSLTVESDEIREWERELLEEEV
jgi:hypothetical protein